MQTSMTYAKKVILALALFFLGCLFYLAYTQQQQQDYNYGKSWWSIYFADPRTNDLSFIIENHSSEKNFHWEISVDKNPLSQGDTTAGLGEKKKITVKALQDIAGKKINLKISTPKSSKEIYKNL